MLASKNGVRKSLGIALSRLGEVANKAILLLDRNGVRLDLTKTDIERSLVQQVQGWEERPLEQVFFEQLERRAVSEDDKEILRRARPFRRLLPEPPPEPKPDPQLEQLILDQVTKKVAAEAALEAVRRQLTSGLVELSKLQQKNPKADHAVLRAQVGRLREDVQTARDAADRESGRLQQLLQIRADRKRAILLAESVKK